MSRGNQRFAVLATLLAAALLAGGFVHAASDEVRSFSAEQLLVRNLIGEIEVVGHSGSAFEVVVRVQGRDATPERIRIETREGSTAQLDVVFPVDEQRRYVYPELGTRSLKFDDRGSDDSGSWFSWLFGSSRSRIEVSGRGKGLELWADLTVRVPRGKSLEISHGAGEIRAADVDADLRLATRVGGIEIARVNGEIEADTGSGRVVIEQAQGEIVVDTGSGNVRLSRSEGDSIGIDTGSGSVEVESVEVRRLDIDTGSGSVDASALGADALSIDTGSGSVEVELTRMGSGKFDIDTGSGRIRLGLPAGAGADVRASTGSGGIEFDVAGEHEVLRKESDEAAIRIGDGGANVVLDTGSGGIRISQE